VEALEVQPASSSPTRPSASSDSAASGCSWRSGSRRSRQAGRLRPLRAAGPRRAARHPDAQPRRAARRVGLHHGALPKTPDTIGLIGEEALRKVKPTVRIINAARGGIVDEHALYVAIKEGRVAGAGLDVYATEPCTDSPLFEFESVVVTPHLGASTDEAQEKAGIAVARSVRLALAGELVPDAVNVQAARSPRPSAPGSRSWRTSGAWRVRSPPRRSRPSRSRCSARSPRWTSKILELSALKGVFSVLVTDPVSYVNAPVLAGERGVAVSLTTSTESASWRNTVRIRLSLTDGQRIVVGGTVTGPRNIQRLVEIDGFDIDVPVSEHVAFLRYTDRPGVVGAAGRLLGEANINIGGMQVSRDEAGGQALIALTVDSAIPADVLAKIAVEVGAISARSVDLPL